MKGEKMRRDLLWTSGSREEGVEFCAPVRGNEKIRERRLPVFRSAAVSVLLRVERPGSASELLERGRFIRGYRMRYRVVVVALLCVLAVFGYYAYWGGWYPKGDKSGIDGRVAQFEIVRAASGQDYLQLGRLIDRLVGYEGQAREAHKNILNQLGAQNPEEDLVAQEIALLMKEFGAEEYSIPTEFLQEVRRFARQYQERDHDLMARLLVAEREDLERMRTILRRANLPEDLAFIVLVESGFLQSSESRNGAVGIWQFTEETARAYGLTVSEAADDRLDLTKSTEAASRYLRDLILDFGAGSSVMLALAAYNSGPDKVRRAVRNVKDPIKQRNFWYLYRARALPEETREYVPKVIAAILIGRNPERFGFQSQ
jgi:hypothetical protein